MSPCLLIFGTKEKKMRKMFINLCEPISAVEKSPYSGMQYTYSGPLERINYTILYSGLKNSKAMAFYLSSQTNIKKYNSNAKPKPYRIDSRF